MVSMGILTLASFGLLTGLMQSQRLAAASVSQATATTIANGYLEQLKALPYSQLDLDPLPTMINQGEADPITAIRLPDYDSASPITDNFLRTNGADTIKTYDIKSTPGDASDDLNMGVAVFTQDITDELNGLGESRLIVLRYTYTYQDNNRTYQPPVPILLKAIRSEVPTN